MRTHTATATHTYWKEIRESLFGYKGSLAIAGLITGLTLSTPAYVQAQCADRIGPNETVVLQSNIEPCSSAGIRIAGPATLDLNGYRIQCTGTTDGLTLHGQKAKVLNGEIRGCVTGVTLTGDGKHRVQGVVATSSRDMGFLVVSDRNVLKNNVASNSAFGSGFRIKGDRNVLSNNVARDGEASGFTIEGDRNRLTKNRSNENDSTGFTITGEKNNLAKNEAVSNARFGFALDDAHGTKLIRNQAELNGLSGIRIAQGSGKNRITRNTARNNGASTGNVDLGDENRDCGTNKWIKNDFDTGNPVFCIE